MGRVGLIAFGEQYYVRPEFELAQTQSNSAILAELPTSKLEESLGSSNFMQMRIFRSSDVAVLGEHTFGFNCH